MKTSFDELKRIIKNGNDNVTNILWVSHHGDVKLNQVFSSINNFLNHEFINKNIRFWLKPYLGGTRILRCYELGSFASQHEQYMNYLYSFLKSLWDNGRTGLIDQDLKTLNDFGNYMASQIPIPGQYLCLNDKCNKISFFQESPLKPCKQCGFIHFKLCNTSDKNTKLNESSTFYISGNYQKVQTFDQS